MDHRRRVGRAGEAWAREFLQRLGYRILAQNFRALRGEVDLVAQDGDTCVFVEVKSAITGEFGLPEERVTERKQQQLARVARAYIQQQPEHERDYRFDVVAVELEPDLTVKNLRHLKDAFWAGGDGG